MWVTFLLVLTFISIQLFNSSSVDAVLSAGSNLDLSGLERIQARITKKQYALKDGRKCPSLSIGAALQTLTKPEYFPYASDITLSAEDNTAWPIMVHSVCLDPDSLGNYLSEYFETRFCSHELGVHYIAAPKLESPPIPEAYVQKKLPVSRGRVDFSRSKPDYPHEFNEASNPFFTHISGAVLHPHPIAASKNFTETNGFTSAYFSSKCPCTYSSCHEKNTSLIYRNDNMQFIGNTFRSAIDAYWKRRVAGSGDRLQFKISQSANISYHVRSGYTDKTVTHASIQSDWPAVPDAAIHYRCGDNVVNHYGFLKFPVLNEIIPPDSQYIYVMAESPKRKQNVRDGKYGATGIVRCHEVFLALENYLHHHFPSSNIVILRGQNMFDDLARLMYARVVVCSISTFCLWPAYTAGLPGGSTSHVTNYMPNSKLIAGGHMPPLAPGLHWLHAQNEIAVLGVEAKAITHNKLIKKLQGLE